MAVTGLSAAALKAALGGANEIALLDVREAGEFAAGHPLFASSVPLSRFEAILPSLVPRPACPLVLIDDGTSGRATWARRLATRLGYSDVRVLTGGTAAWVAAGFSLYEGVYVPSKAFGELVEEKFLVPHINATALAALQATGAELILIDGRPLDEHQKMSVPGSICVPNGELAYRAEHFVPPPGVPIVVHCAGRTRSILGAQILRDLALPNPVFALENGTQGWTLAGLSLEHGSTRRIDVQPSPAQCTAMEGRARELAELWGVPRIEPKTLEVWGEDPTRTLYVFDVRTAAEFAQDHLPGARHAPGGQLLQSTDTWVAVRRARIVLLDDNGLRAVIIGRWLGLMGHDAYVLSGGSASWDAIAMAPARVQVPVLPLPGACDVTAPGVLVVDCRSSAAYRAGHLAGAIWTIRSSLSAVVQNLDRDRAILICGDDPVVTSLLAHDLTEMGFNDLAILAGGAEDWRARGLQITATPQVPNDSAAIDFVFFTHDRHNGNLGAARQYIAWETGLVARLDEQERAAFGL